MCNAVKFQPKFWKILSLAIFHWHSPSGRTLTLRTTQSLIISEYQDHFLRVKGASMKGWKSYRLHMLIVSKSDNLKFLEPSGPVQARAGIVLPLPVSSYEIRRQPSAWSIYIYIYIYIYTGVPKLVIQKNFCNNFWNRSNNFQICA
jgi:hypothetical protein